MTVRLFLKGRWHGKCESEHGMTQRPRAARLILLLPLVFSAFFAAACGESPEVRKQKALARGEGYLIPLLSPLVAQLPRYIQARFLLGPAHLASQNPGRR